MKKTIYIFTLIILLSSINNYFAQNWLWKKEISGRWSPDQTLYSTNSNNIIFAGSYKTTFAINAVNFIDPGNTNTCAFVAKFDTSGTCLWQNPIYVGMGCYTPNSSPNRLFFKVDVMTEDSQGNIYIGGWYEGCNCNFGNGVTLNGAGQAMYFAKFNSTGQCQWAKLLNEANNGQGIMKGYFESITIDNVDNVYLSIGKYLYPQTFFGLNFNSRGFYILKLDLNGNGIWLKQTSGISNGYIVRELKYKNNKIYAISDYFNTTTIATQSFICSGSNDIALVKLDTAGNELNAINISGSGLETGLNVVLTSDNKVIILCESGSSTLTLGTATLNTTISSEFLASYDINLNLLSYKSVGDNTTCLAYGAMAADNAGSFYVGCNYTAPTVFDGIAGSTTGASLIKYNGSLQALWADGNAGGVITDNANNAYTIRYTDVNTNFGPFNVTASTGSEKIILAKINATATGIHDNGKLSNNPNVYPNPSASGVFNIVLPKTINNVNGVILKLYNGLGQVINDIKYTVLSYTTINLNLSNQPEGTYEVSIVADGQKYSAKVVR